MEVTGKITKILDKKSGTSKAGKEWSKQSFVIDNNESYNNIFCFELFGEEKIENFNKYNKIGSNVKVDFNVRCNEWEGNYFTSLQAWKVFKADLSDDNLNNAVSAIDSAFPSAESVKTANEQDDDLPF